MATVFMRWLETRPGDYDRGIRILTLGKLEPLQQKLVDRYVKPGSEVLEIGCGTGLLTTKLARAGSRVTAIDRSISMLDQARIRVHDQDFENEVELIHMDATGIGDQFKSGSFDVIVSSLAFSEMGPQEQQYVLHAVRKLLRMDGEFFILDEFKPKMWLPKILSTLVHLPLRALTWLLTRTTTSPLDQYRERVENAGFSVNRVASALGGTLQVIGAKPQADTMAVEDKVVSLGPLRGGWTWKAALTELWALFFRILPPYPKQDPGLYTVGDPGPEAPLLVTGNYLLTVQRLVRAIDGRMDAWVLVADSGGINVWCAGGGGFLTAERILAAWRLSGLNRFLEHRSMILPQLCANGVDGGKIRDESGWQVHWGPVRAQDLPAYIKSNLVKTDDMRWVSFPLRSRLEMMAATLGFYALMILIPVAIFWRILLLPLTISLVALSVFYAITLNALPGRDGLAKSVPLAGIAVLGMLVFSAFQDHPTAQVLFNRAVGLTGLSVFIGSELQGMSPQMRGEQANWGWEALIAVGLVLVYWLVPRLAGWR